MAGLEEPDDGRLYIDGKIVAGAATGTYCRRKSANLEWSFNPTQSGRTSRYSKTLHFRFRRERESADVIRQRVDHALESVGLGGFADRGATQLSGGATAAVALARALVYEPAVLLLDEPLSNLDAKLREQMRFELRALQRKLTLTILYVTHDQTEAMTLSDRIAVVNRGRSEQSGIA